MFNKSIKAIETKYNGYAFGVLPYTNVWSITYKTPTPIHEQNLKHALLTAKQSRFEHGENGAEKKVRHE